MQSSPIPRWAFLSVVNLLIVTILGVTLRYKGAFSLPFIEYKYVLNAHSHFAFSGWITTALFTAFIWLLDRSGREISPVYRRLFWLNQASSFGMLVGFFLAGYGVLSIFFSAVSIVFSCWFAIRYYIDMSKTNYSDLVKRSIRFALIFLVLSCLGPLLLGYGMSHRIENTSLYFNAIYLYLHFQYNGWFTFAVIALFFWSIYPQLSPSEIRLGRLFISLMGYSCIPAYGLSVLWTDPPGWVWMLSGCSGILQLLGLCVLCTLLLRRHGEWLRSVDTHHQALWGLAFTAFSIKLVLQGLSAFPYLNRLASGHRPVVIAYLHLVLLGFVTLMILGFFAGQKLIATRSSISNIGIVLFAFGVVANEAVLLIQSLQAFAGLGMPVAPYILLATALIMFFGMALLTFSRPHA